jgi:mono/diheme cytochrome c family protein
MKKLNAKLVLAATLILVSSLACNLSLAEDVLPPPGADLSGQPVESTEIEYPSSAIDLAHGAEIYAQSCAPCHGESGLGDGPQAGDLPFEVPPIGTIAFGAEPALDDWFLQVTDGNLDKFMPPFGQSYSVQERWEILAYVANIWSIGKDWNQQFEELGLPAGFSDLAIVAPLSGGDLYRLIEDSGAITNLELSVEEQTEIIGFSKLLALGGAEIAEPVEEIVIENGDLDSADESEDLTDAPANGIHGQLVNGGGGGIPDGLEVILHSTDNIESVEIDQVRVDTEGNFTFADIGTNEAHRYFFSVDVQGLKFFSNFYSAEQFYAAEIALVEFFESSQEVEDLHADVVNLVFNFTSEGQVQVIQQAVLSNNGTKAAAPGSDGAPLLYYELPPDAANILFESGQAGDRYFFNEDGFGDIRAVLPGNASYQLLFAYDLPYERDLAVELPLQFSTANLGIFVPQGLIQIEGEDFVFHGPQVVQSQSYDSYLFERQLDAGERVSFQITGLHPLNESAWQSLINNRSLLIGMFALLGTIAGGWWWYRTTQFAEDGAPAESKDDVLAAIVELDDAFENSELSDGEYLKWREILKSELRQAISQKKKRIR